MNIAFNETMMKIIRDYKNLRKRIYKRPAATSSVYKQMGINRMILRNASEIKLYNIGLKIIKDLDNYLASKDEISTVHCGVEKFLHHVKNTLGEYTVEKKHVTHKQRKTSYDMLEAVQLVSLPLQKITPNTMDKINLCASSVLQNGSTEQIEILKTAFKQNKHRIKEFCKRYGKMLCLRNDLYDDSEREEIRE